MTLSASYSPHSTNYRRTMPVHRQNVRLAITSAVAAVALAASVPNKTPYHTSSLSGEGWIWELLDGHDDRIHHELGMHREVFLALVQILRSLGYQDSREVTLEEQLGILLYTCQTGLFVRHIGK